MKISVILPTYCERDNIADLIRAIEHHLDQEGWLVEIVVVDDNSPDGTADIVKALQLRDAVSVQCHVRTEERGLASAIRYGVRQATGDVVVVMDTDFNHDPAQIPQMIAFLKFYDLIIGSRFVMGGGMDDRPRYAFSFLYNIFVRLWLQNQIQDNLSGFFAIRREQLLALNADAIFEGYGEYFIRLLFEAARKKYRILEVPVYYTLRRHGKSKSRFVSMLWNYSKCVLSLRFQSSRQKAEAR
jgi:dolichol-phosphate mannosyltransferase